MPKYYSVDVEARDFHTFIVKADDEDHAEELACDMMGNKYPSADIYVASCAVKLTAKEVSELKEDYP